MSTSNPSTSATDHRAERTPVQKAALGLGAGMIALGLALGRTRPINAHDR